MTAASPSSLSAHLALVTVLSFSSLFFFYKSRRLRTQRLSSPRNPNPNPNPNPRGKLFFASQTGTSKTLAARLLDLLQSNSIPFDLVDPKTYEPEDLPKETLVLFVASTWEDGKPPSNAQFLAQWLAESAEDFRVGSLILSRCKFAVFGVGSRAYDERFNKVGKDLSLWMRALGAAELVPVAEGDVDGGDLDVRFGLWSERVVKVLKGEGGDDGVESDVFDVLEEEVEDEDDDYDDEEDEEVESEAVDMEDIAGKAPSKKSGSGLANGDNGAREKSSENGFREMVTPVVRASLQKQGYKIIGSHSGVKICRWTKSQLRGRGGCYKHSFYGIESHRCMEATPSLACANKCVFCWRHHTNPVGKSWRWKMDDPLVIVNAAIDQHTKMIKQMKGVPGVTQERLSEGLSPRHCALSLVGEPIMYPEINSLVDELHRRHISTFLVTNAQFPEKIKALRPITQLYVSVDAATKESLKAIDRPLFGDFWERFIVSTFLCYIYIVAMYLDEVFIL
ncbi:S-adenosyl-L-methionine-dependent tRNA 4-demethylwyosine synthase-like [Asparagus officinalis]|uniref:S-adenosyl-L-methionine-dependent tRNA 4-demethylwyosine synthase-like n=1 Tax=Asparagus officinalis TaxID=4686 RepID=UPI00098E8374|nr:S-adenosyl-L-methionine-dependent tRNA 4-demethylwyosine synthase-like [Asparagus officinalis]